MFGRFGVTVPIGDYFLVFSPDNSRFFIPDDHLSRGVLEDIYLGRVYDRLGHPLVGNVVVDAGAHVGLYSIKASRLVGPKGIVLAFEPHPLNYAVLTSNIQLNSIGNVEAICSALGDSDDYVKLHLAHSDSVSHSIMPHSIMPRSEDFVLAKVRRLDTVVGEYPVRRIDFIKMDVEGAELLLLKGAEKTLKESRPRLAIATYHYPKEIEEVADCLRKLDYNLYRLGQSYLYAVHKKR